MHKYLSSIYYKTNIGKLDLEIQKDQTKILNLSNIAKIINRPEFYLMKFLELELDQKVNIIEHIIYNKCNIDELEKLMEKFIYKYVTCGNCYKQNTNLKTINNIVYLKCNSCGNINKINHKLNYYIIDTYSELNPNNIIDNLYPFQNKLELS